MFNVLIISLSFFLDGVCSNLIQISNLCYPLFSLLSLIIVYPYFYKKNRKKYYIYAFLTGNLYDILYTNTLFLNGFYFLLISVFINMIYNLITNNIYNSILISIFIIICYRLFTYLFLLLIGYVKLDIKYLFESIYSSLFINIIYIILFYNCCYLIDKKMKRHRGKKRIIICR